MKILIIVIFSFLTGAQTMDKTSLKSKLSPMEYEVTVNKGTEPAFNNKYWNNKEDGIYVDVATSEALFSSTDKFDSESGWPSFTKPISSNCLKNEEDNSLFMNRTEVRTSNSDLHFCINSAALKFIPKKDMKKLGYEKYLYLFVKKAKTETAIFAAGCFWGVEAIFKKIDGVTKTTVGYTGGNMEKPSYEDVRTGNTNHAEAVQVEFNPDKISYKELLGYFWRLHNPTTLNRQGYNTGSQYRSAIFYFNDKQKETALKAKDEFNKSGVFKEPVVTQLAKASTFYPAEDYHQDYYGKKKINKFCHILRSK